MVSHTQHTRELADHELEHVVATLWDLDERAEASLDRLREASRVEHFDDVIKTLGKRRLIYASDGSVALTPEGQELAESLVRRHRLAESLFSSVLDVRDDHAVEGAACAMEHVLSSSVTDSVCSFLGHPKFCPHGKPIPAGGCCRSFSGVELRLQQKRPATVVAVGETTLALDRDIVSEIYVKKVSEGGRSCPYSCS
jgi:Mn-dependent DtxR family transcriptional regulator